RTTAPRSPSRQTRSLQKSRSIFEISCCLLDVLACNRTGPVQGLTSGTMLRVVYRNPGWSYLIPSYPSQLHAMTLYEISAGSCQIHERLGSWIQLRRGWRCQSSNNQHVPVLQQGCRMSRTIKSCETRKDEGTCGRVVDLGNCASTTEPRALCRLGAASPCANTASLPWIPL